MAGAGTLQLLVRRTMLEAGGYWRPLAAVARLAEELGELAELLEGPRAPVDELAGELADLWIITTALADQFLIAVPDPATGSPDGRPGGASPAARLVITAGQIARVINFYDGPKPPRRPGELPSLTAVMGEFHRELGLLSGRLGIDLARAVDEKLARVRAGADMRRFERDASDPSTAAILGALPPGSAPLRAWGAPADPSSPVAELARALVPSLSSFTRAAVAEGLAAYIVGAPWPAGTEGLARWWAELVRELELLDPRGTGEPAATGACGLSFNGMRLNATTLALEGAATANHSARALLVLAPADGGVLAGPGGDGP